MPTFSASSELSPFEAAYFVCKPPWSYRINSVCGSLEGENSWREDVVSVYTQFVFTFGKNCKADEEQTWLLSFRERDGNQCCRTKKTKPETLYIIAAVKSDIAV